MLWDKLMAVGDLGRLYDIASILVRYGFGDVVRRMGLANALERAGRALHWSHPEEFAHLPPADRVRRALEEMGPTFVKLGQLLATRVDLFEPDWIAEFGKLQDRAPVAPEAAIRQHLTEDLGAPPEEVFAAFDPEPMAAGSIAQVHRARLEDGTEVVVKVRRPGIRTIIDADVRWLSRLAELAETESAELRTFHPREVVLQFADSLRSELDFSVEGRSAERIAHNFVGYTDKDEPRRAAAEAARLEKPPPPIIVIPRVFWPWTVERVCVQEFVDGIAGTDLGAVDRSALDRKVLARRGARAFLKMMVEDGFFHADPHPGNVFYLAGNRIAFIDFGMVGRLTEERRSELTRLLLGLVRLEPRRIADVLLDWTADGDVDEPALILQIERFVDQYHGVPLKQLKVGAMLSDLVAILRRNHLALPADLALLIKALISLEGMGRELDPDFDMAGEALPLLERAFRGHYRPDALARRGWRAASEALSLIADLPSDLSRMLRAARRGRLEIHIDVPHLKRVGDQLDRSANRLVAGMVVAALIIGSSIAMTVPGGPTLVGLPLFGLVGFFGAVIGGAWLLLSIRSHGRGDHDRDA